MLATPESRLWAKQIAYHQMTLPEDARHAGLFRELHRWLDIFLSEWQLDIPRPVLHVEPIRNAYAYYDFGRGGLGTPDNIVFNSLTLDRPAAYVIRTLGHELIHLWQQYHGKPTQKRNWHNDEYIAKANSLGILIDHQGCTSGHDETFAALINKHGVDLPDYQEVSPGILIPPTGGIEPKVYGTRTANGGGSRLKKWECGCTIVRCSVELAATCTKCGQPFARAE